MATAPPTSKDSNTLQPFDDIILDIAGQVPHDRYHALGVKLGFTWQVLDNILYKHTRDVRSSATEVLMAWRTEHGFGPAQRQEFRHILLSAGLGYLAAKLTDGPLDTLKPFSKALDRGGQVNIIDKIPSSVSASISMNIENIIRDVAERLVKKADIELLGMHLGFEKCDIEKYYKQNLIGEKVTSDGTKDMIRDWKEKKVHILDDFWPFLLVALLAAGSLRIVGIIEEKYPDLRLLHPIYRTGIGVPPPPPQLRL